MIIWFSVLLGLLSMLGYGLANVYSKPLSQKLGPAQVLFLRGFTICVVLGLASISSYHYLHQWALVLACIGLGAMGYLPVLAFTHGIKESPLGVVAPIASTSPLVTVMLAFAFLNVPLRPMQWAAIGLVVLANVLVSVDLKNWRDSRFLRLSSGIPFALVAAIGWGLFFFALVPLTKSLGPWLAAWLVEIGVTVAAGAHLLLSSKRVMMKDALKPGVIANGVLICLGTVAFTVGVTYFNVGVVAALSNSTALIATLLGVYLFKEKLTIKEKLTAAMMISGVVVISLF